MMKKIFVVLSVLLIVACGKEPKEAEQLPDTDTEAIAVSDTLPAEGERLIIEDRSLYSEEFLASLEKLNYSSQIRLIDNYMLIEGDTVNFPDELKIDEAYHFTGFTEKRFYQLDVQRISLTALEFEYAVYENEQLVYQAKGTAHLNAGFFLGSETADDDETGDAYALTEYSTTGKDQITIKIGEPDNRRRLRAVVSGGKPNEAVNPTITLRESI